MSAASACGPVLAYVAMWYDFASGIDLRNDYGAGCPDMRLSHRDRVLQSGQLVRLKVYLR